jgi:hypothetical protein
MIVFKTGTAKLLALFSFHLNEQYAKRGKVGKNTRTRVFVIKEAVCVRVCVRAQHTLRLTLSHTALYEDVSISDTCNQASA